MNHYKGTKDYLKNWIIWDHFGWKIKRRQRCTCSCMLTIQPHLFTWTVLDLSPVRLHDGSTCVYTEMRQQPRTFLLPGVLFRWWSGNRMVKHCHQVPSGCYCFPAAQQSFNTRTHTHRVRLTHHFLFSQQLSPSVTQQVQAVSSGSSYLTILQSQGSCDYLSLKRKQNMIEPTKGYILYTAFLLFLKPMKSILSTLSPDTSHL